MPTNNNSRYYNKKISRIEESNTADLHNKISVEEREVKVKLRKVSKWCLLSWQQAIYIIIMLENLVG